MIEISAFSEYILPARPRRLMKYIMIWCSKGMVALAVDDKEIQLTGGDALTITSGQYHWIKSLDNASGFILQFTLDYFCKDDHDIELVFHNGLFCHFDLNEIIHVIDSPLVEQQLHLIKKELQEKPYQYLLSVHARIKLILIALNREKVNRGDEIYKPEALFLKFLEAVRKDLSNNHPLSYYAGLLHTTEAKLNEQAKKHAGKTAQNVIYGLITSEAKRLLMYEDITVKETAYRLGFNDPFYFSNFFKKNVNISPKAYQEQYSL